MWPKMTRFQQRKVWKMGIVIIAIMVLAFLAFEIDIFVTEHSVSDAQRAIELDEVLLLGGCLAIVLFIYASYQYAKQRREMHRRIASEKHARELAYQDVLTGLPNRRQFDEALKAAIDAPPGAQSLHAVFLLDLNGFKQINDIHGHETGDEVLVGVSRRMVEAVRDGDVVARFGGDEFAILAKHLISSEAATNIALRIIQALGTPIQAGGTAHQVGTGIGIACIPGDATNVSEAIRKADVALYRAKAERRSAFRFFEAEMDRLAEERDRLERELTKAVAANEIKVFFQPAFDLKSESVVGFEAMPRWTHAEFGEISADRFISIAEDTGLIHSLADRLMRQALTAAATWPSHVTVTIRIFQGQLTDKNLQARLMTLLQDTGVAPERLEIDIAESVLVRNLQGIQDIFGGLRSKGVKVALSGFGTGYSSLYHLRNFKLDKIKIDRSFVETVSFADESVGIVNALVGLGHGLGLTVAAEGVADREQRSSLLRSGCEQGIGHLFGGPIAAEAASALAQASEEKLRRAG